MVSEGFFSQGSGAPFYRISIGSFVALIAFALKLIGSVYAPRMSQRRSAF